MIATIPTLVEHIAMCWSIIRAIPPERGRWPRINLRDGVCRLEYRREYGHDYAVFTCKGRPLRSDEEEAMRVGCAVPAEAERIPAISQDRVSDYRIGIVGQWRYQVMYRWKEEA